MNEYRYTLTIRKEVYEEDYYDTHVEYADYIFVDKDGEFSEILSRLLSNLPVMLAKIYREVRK